MARRQPNAELVDARVALAKARLAVLAQEAAAAPGAVDRVAAMVRTRPWRGVGVALGVGFALGLSRGVGARALGAVAGPLVAPLGAVLASTVLRQFGVGAPSATSALASKVTELRSRAATR